jgi:60 kDa SS-A/Ro ribonucleoprotein
MGITALVRNLATLTRNGLLTPMSYAENMVISKLTDEDLITKGRVHPIQMLSALRTYDAGRGFRGTNTWTPNARVTAAVEDGFYKAFKKIVPTGKRFYLAIDVSGSMTGGEIAGVSGLSPNVASACMAMVTARSEQNYYIAGFTSVLKNLNIAANDTLASAMQKTQDRSFGSTDCAQPMLDALAKKMEVDTFVVYTDSETWAGNIQPVQALKKYRDATGINARLVVVGMTATNFTIADPKDGGMLDVVGFDSAAPNIIADFSRGKL